MESYRRESPNPELTAIWPIFGLEVETERMLLRFPSENDVAALADLVAADGVHDPDEMPFQVPWTRAEPPELQRGMLRFRWRGLADWEPASWRLDLAAWTDGEPVGSQGIVAADFAVTRTAVTGSWLARSRQGRGLGTEMRHAILHLLFNGMGAVEARSEAWDDNVASAAVSAKCGYVPDGTYFQSRDGEPCRSLRFVATPESWRATDPPDVTIRGLEACRGLLGLDARPNGA